MTEDIFYQRIASALNLDIVNVKNTCVLLDDKNSIPFIARYRKEMTGSLDEVEITAIQTLLQKFRDIEKRRKFILATIEESGNLTEELNEKIYSAETMEELEDLYLPFKPKKKTRASVAKERGLEPLSKIIMMQREADIKALAAKYIDEEKGVTSVEDAIAGASDIIAEWVNEHTYTRSRIRHLFETQAHITSKVVNSKKEEGALYSPYFDYDEPIKKVPSHRVLAVFRGENEKVLRVSVAPDSEQALEIINKIFIKNATESAKIIEKAIKDSYKRLLEPSIENEIRNMVKEKADKAAISVFADNLRQLLMAPPLIGKNVLAIDPGFRTGCKITILDKTGKLLNNITIYPHPPEDKVKDAINKLTYLVEAYKIDAIAIGNGTAGRETENFIKRIHFNLSLIHI